MDRYGLPIVIGLRETGQKEKQALEKIGEQSNNKNLEFNWKSKIRQNFVFCFLLNREIGLIVHRFDLI